MSRVIGVLSFLWLVLPLEAVRAAALPAPVILVFGDSISAGYGIAPESGWVNLLSNRLRQEGYGFQVVNASVSGETTTGGLARLPRALAAHAPRIVIIELGGQRRPARIAVGQHPSQSRRHDRPGGSPRPIGPAPRTTHATELWRALHPGFSGNYATLARAHRVPLVPFLLEVCGPARTDAGRWIAPNERGQPILLDNVWPVLKPLLRMQPH